LFTAAKIGFDFANMIVGLKKKTIIQTMISTPSPKWLSAELHYNEPWERFLVHALAPYTDTVIKNGISNCFYFERAWKRGPHIKLNIRSSAFVVDTIMTPNIKEHFEYHFSVNPSLLNVPRYPVNFPEHHKWFENNTIQFAEYHTQFEKFGGSLGWSICEKQFHNSSSLVLHILSKNTKSWSVDNAVSAAIEMHLSLAASFGLNRADMIEFFKLVDQKYKRVDFKQASLNQSIKANNRLKIEENFELQKENLIAYHSAILAVINHPEDVKSQTFNEWNNANCDVYNQLQLGIEYDRIHPIAPRYSIDPEAHLDKEKAIIWNILSELISLNNNRLGIHGAEALYLSHAMKECIQVEQKVQIDALELVF